MNFSPSGLLEEVELGATVHLENAFDEQEKGPRDQGKVSVEGFRHAGGGVRKRFGESRGARDGMP
jgi:hypothetical protein